MAFIRQDKSASFRASGEGPNAGSSGMGSMLVRRGEPGGVENVDEAEFFRPYDDDRECKVPRESSRELIGEDGEDCDVPGLLGVLESELVESSDNRRRTCVCCECRSIYD